MAESGRSGARLDRLRVLLTEKLRVTQNGSISIIKQDSQIVQINVSCTKRNKPL
ncbi:MAG: hypothetical protein LBF95_04905 [Treponema sp.]|jgi:hypothetical protein|nr:hypothetical protein [Treponema sp.]